MKDGRTLFWIADGSGHGAAAALLTTLAKLLFHHGSAEQNAPASVMEAVNDDFRSIFGGRSFMTAMCVAINHKTGRAHAVGAGHPPLLIVRQNGATESIASVAPPLGLVERPKFVETALDFEPGDAFLLYTDGLFGSSGNGRRRVTPQQLAKMLDYSAPTAEVLLKRILERVTPNNPEDSLSDDMTALAVRRMAPE
jgi:sigma-B regulation protein RsbU (phosphoserine phosphatase)